MFICRKPALFIALALILSIVLTACAGESDKKTEVTTDDNKEVVGGDLIIDVTSDASVLDPQNSSDVPSANIQTNIFETLVKKDENQKIIPGLAESWEPIDDTTWEFKLREDVKFHDGESFSAEAVKKSLDRIRDPEVASPRFFIFEMISDIEVIDDFTIQMTTDYPFAPLLSHLAHPAGVIISPKSIDEDYAAMEDGATSGSIISENPIGTGYFKFDSWEPGEKIILVKNEEYWGDLAHVDIVTFKVIPESGTRLAELETGFAHIIEPVQPSEVPLVTESEQAEIDVEISSSLSYIGFNVTKAPFNDVRVRQAISMLVNKEEILEGIYDGFGLESNGPLAPGVFGYIEDKKTISHNPEKALELLKEAGYEDGFKTVVWTNDNPQRVDTAVVLQQALKEANIDVDIEILEWGAYLDKVDSGDHDLFILGLTNPVGDADYFLRSLFHSASKGAGGNNSFYDNPLLDQLLDEAREEIDESARLAIYDEIQSILIEDAPLIYVHHQAFLTGVSNQIKGYWIDSSGYYQLQNVEFVD
ncbi:glutathione ABC transporter substrate-binding protein [Sporosarcina sp. G11-34]|uniref:glutathione ABC transporter substrate-binding protein n=1 Tax=Sporosarcina sp. G11-34 TaxID=2849605 RepID=UPI0022A9908F|nr:glutathione ABC transporter substrate-binding protein [Sporosarcina sp. G11-34]MCZ2257243.1 glutathione ABC transporter substrate-binding protein [Sporosarcina sp. G11-34]